MKYEIKRTRKIIIKERTDNATKPPLPILCTSGKVEITKKHVRPIVIRKMTKENIVGARFRLPHSLHSNA